MYMHTTAPPPHPHLLPLRRLRCGNETQLGEVRVDGCPQGLLPLHRHPAQAPHVRVVR